ncbi:tyrosinase [Xenopus laevis]|uniref:Tyrosinase n=2 Tax=Xenopus laevis TaxID=8355 RepID=A0A8J1L3K0_XENLA|nr:tyrosinase [Xenopus laevis]
MHGLWILLALSLSGVHSQFPRGCTTNEALQKKTCCSEWTDGTPCGSGSGRGKCRPSVVPVISVLNESLLYDDRLNWPHHYYDRTCECFGNYSGFNCGYCKYGYYGDKCDQKKTLVRKEIRELTLVERKRIFSYLALAKTTKSKDFVVLTTGDRHNRDTYTFVDASVYDVFSWIHYYSMKPIMKKSVFIDSKNYAHQGPAFLGWHRLGLLFLEREIQLMTGDEDFALPYYDWRGEKNCSICTNDFLGDNDAQGNLSPYSHFSYWKVICSGYDCPDVYCRNHEEHTMEKLLRKPGSDPLNSRFPSFQDVEDTLKWGDFDTPPYNETSRKSFRNSLEGYLRPSDGETLELSMHNLVHMYLGGTMAQVPISTNDPMFLLHHNFIDKILEIWINKYNGTPELYPENREPGQGPYECTTPYFPCYQNKDLLQTSRHFGYTFSKYQEFGPGDSDEGIVTAATTYIPDQPQTSDPSLEPSSGLRNP